MNENWAWEYVGIPYKELDCANLVSLVQSEVFDRQVVLPTERGDVFLQSAIIGEEKERGTLTENPEDGDAVILVSQGRINHIGVFFSHEEPSVLHSIVGLGAIVTRIRDLNRMNMRVEGFYKWPS